MRIRRVTFIKPQAKRIRVKKERIKRPVKAPPKKIELKKSIYILPSLFTCGNMTFGILSIFSSIEGDFIRAAWFLIGALACDILDGRIARMTNTTSDFGMQLDTLSDLVSFGTAPAVLMYMLVLKTMGNIGIAIAVLFVLCSALRLARFNVLSQRGEVHKHFVGLPTPASAGVIISFVLSYKLLAPEEHTLNYNTIPVLMEIMPAFFKIMPVVMAVLSFLMVSNIPYMAFKNVKLSKIRTIELLALLIVLIILVVIFPQNTIFIIFTIYAVSGLLFYVPRIILNNKNKKKNGDQEEENENEV
uniref:CDP-diacylglycerol--serine O-phosphatidyltransferase n=1 Tax=uncultured bacterium contig00027 TaxID=1181516 RepID=A0A806KR55_9BACT|nr:CDP-diacylglycerol--serine O-phosphatidyltransferase [uncultured bacterium contig00027]